MKFKTEDWVIIKGTLPDDKFKLTEKIETLKNSPDMSAEVFMQINKLQRR